ncbi:MAG: hypothetical protein WAM77_29960 [Xanthobacteraceae bacterium]
MAEIAPERFEPIAEALGVTFDAADPKPAALTCADQVAAFIAGFEVPNSLRKAGVKREEVVRIVGQVQEEVNFAGVVDRPVTVEEIAALLDAAYD